MPTILFIPVSSPSGIGEYVRSKIIARQVLEKWPHTKIHFILSQQAPYLSECPFKSHTTPQSPTKHNKLVKAILKKVQPDLVIFDAAGTSQQVSYAKKIGAKVIFISQHDKKRAKGLKISRLLNLDAHWVVQPDFVMGTLTWFEKLKLKLLSKKTPAQIGPIFERVSSYKSQQILKQYKLTVGQFLLFNAGSGGHLIENNLAADIFAETAAIITSKHHKTCVMVFGANYPKPLPNIVNVICIAQLDNSDFINLMSAAEILVLSGGDSVLQAVSLNKPCVAAPVSKDQPARIALCAERGLLLASATNPKSLVQAVQQLLTRQQQQKLINSIDSRPVLNGLDYALNDISQLLELEK